MNAWKNIIEEQLKKQQIQIDLRSNEDKKRRNERMKNEGRKKRK
jgi:tRNA A37 threonylcarbamoyladenosine biosynthesis protein TsaE